MTLKTSLEVVMKTNYSRLVYILRKGKFIMLAIGIAIVIFNVTNTSVVSTIVSSCWIVITVLASIFNRRIWKSKRVLKFMQNNTNIYCPYIAGRWSGTLIRDGINHDFVLEIKQTYTSISCSTYSHHSNSNSWSADILFDEQKKKYLLVYLWQGKTTKSPSGKEDPTNYFYGTTMLEINDDCDKLTGSYYTDRNPTQTKGEIYLIERQENLKNVF